MGEAADDLIEGSMLSFEDDNIDHPYCTKCGCHHDDYVSCHLTDDLGNYNTDYNG